MNRTLSTAVISALVVLAFPLVSSAQAEVADLGTLGGDFSYAYGVNDAGQVVGVSATASNFENHAFLWENGVMTDLGTLGGGYSEARAINAAGVIVGLSTGGSGYLHAFRYQNGVMTDLGTLGGNTYSYAVGINDAGEIIGFSPAASGHAHAFKWKDGVMTDLGVLPGGIESNAYGINEAGAVTGYSDSSQPQAQGILWQGGTMTQLGTYNGANFSIGYDINDSGNIALYSYNLAENRYAAFLYDHGIFTDIGTLGNTATPQGINNQNHIVGWSIITNPQNATKPFVWRNNVIEELPTLPGGQSGIAYDISNTGYAVGYSEAEEGFSQRAVLWSLGDSSPLNRVQDLITKVQTMVTEGALNKGQGSSLTVTLTHVLTALDGDPREMCQQLDVFISKVQAQTGKAEPSSDAAEFVTAAQALKSDLCS